MAEWTGTGRDRHRRRHRHRPGDRPRRSPRRASACVIVGRRPAPLDDTVARSPKANRIVARFRRHHECRRPRARRRRRRSNGSAASTSSSTMPASRPSRRSSPRPRRTGDASWRPTSMRPSSWRKPSSRRCASATGAASSISARSMACLALNPSLYDTFTDDRHARPEAPARLSHLEGRDPQPDARPRRRGGEMESHGQYGQPRHGHHRAVGRASLRRGRAEALRHDSGRPLRQARGDRPRGPLPRLRARRLSSPARKFASMAAGPSGRPRAS